MAILSLRATISALSALSVAVVAAITLSITLTTSLSALRSIGQTHATSLLTNARLQTEALFHRPVIATETVSNVTRSKLWKWPSDDATVADMYHTMFLDQFLACEGYCTISAAFDDSTLFQFNGYNADMYSGYMLMPAPYSKGGLAYQATQPITITRFAGYWANNTSPPLTDPVFNQSINAVLLASTPGWQAQKNTYGQPQGISFGGVAAPPGVNQGFSVVLYSHTVTTDPTYLYGATAIALDLSAIRPFLLGVVGTPHTVLFAYDDGGYMIGTNLDAPFYARVAINASYVAPPGCSSNAQFAAVGDGTLVGWCRTHISQYGYAPLASIASDNTTIFTSSTAVGMFSTSGDTYYYAVANVYLKYPGMGVWLALIMPETDIIGDVVTGRNTAIGVTCGVFVVVAVVTFAAIALLLRPLTAIADRMMLAAGLEDDAPDDGADRSAMAEVEDLQDAYAAMNAELNRIKSFVPKTVLRKAHRDVDADEDDEDLTASASQRRSTREMDRATTQSRASRRSKKSSNNMATHLECGLMPQSVTIVSGDMEGFDAAVQSMARQDVINRMSHTVQLVHDAAAAHKGVVQSFHGDHFVVTFNAVSPCAAHARRGATAALQVSSRATTCGMQLPVRVGVATGRCLVGNLGSQEAKGFNTIGAAFVQAGLLQRLARDYGTGCRVLATRRTCADIATHLKFLYVDIVPLPVEATLVGAVLGAAAADTSQAVEWLYVVAGNGDGTTVEDVVNNAFVHVANGHCEEAAAILANQLCGVDLCDMKNGLRCQLVQRLNEAAARPTTS